MRAALALVLLLLPGAASAAIRPARAEIVVENARDLAQFTLDLDVMDGRQVAFHLACLGDGRTVRCQLNRKGRSIGAATLDPMAALTGGPREAACQAGGVLLTLSVSDLIQTQPAPIADSYRFRVSATPSQKGAAAPCG